MSTNGARNRSAGHGFELDCRNKFRKIGFTKLETSRFVSKERDHNKIDLCYPDELDNGRFPFNVQCKNTSSINYQTEFHKIPITPGIKNVILHKQTERKGTKMMTKGLYAFMHLEDFYDLVEELQTLRNGKTRTNRCG